MNIDQFFLPRTIGDFIYNNLKAAILNNEFKANQRINEKVLAERFQVSRTPVREAVLRLAAQGFVHIDSYKRAIVKKVSYEELREILQVLTVLDQLAVELVLDFLGPIEVNKLETLTQQMDKYARPETAELYLQADSAFHREIWNLVPNIFLREVLLSVMEKKERYMYASVHALKQPEKFERGVRQHREIISAIKAKDRERLKTLVASRRHLILESLGDQQDMIEFFRTSGA